jgi:hypothetical protein
MGLFAPYTIHYAWYRVEAYNAGDDDCFKYTFDLYDGGNFAQEIDWNPYSRMTEQDLERWLLLGRPERIGIGPLDRRQLDQIEAAAIERSAAFAALIGTVQALTKAMEEACLPGS